MKYFQVLNIQGVEHSACTMDDAPNGVPWCKVGENGITLIYDDCNMDTCKGIPYIPHLNLDFPSLSTV